MRGAGAAVALLAGAVVTIAIATVACGSPPRSQVQSTGSGLTPAQRRHADKLISAFENGTQRIQYCYIEALHDGRGYTAGRAGFTSATGDLLEVVERYTHAVGSNALSPYLSRLRELARNEDGSIAGLEGLPDAWGATCSNPRQRRVQDAIVDTEYYRPAQRHWRDQGLKTALSLAAIYDAEVQHGDGDDPDGVPAMLRRAQTSAHGTPRSGVAESRFVRAFLSVRKRTLLHAHDPETRQVWRQSVGRVAAWSYLVQTHQWRLRAPVRVRTRDYDLTIR